MTKSTKKTVHIKDLPPPKGYTIAGGAATKKVPQEAVKVTTPKIERFPG